MARLTERYESGGTAMIKGCGDNCKYGCKHCTQGGDIGDCGTIDDVVDKLAYYEDAEERGLLLKLPCKVGDTVYLVGTYRNPSIDEMGVEDILLRDDEVYISLIDITDSDYDATIRGSDFGKTVFHTREEAEKALADMGV